MKLGDFQDAFVEALYAGASASLPDLIRQPGFTVYRNTVMKGAVDALIANFPTVERLVGSEWLNAAATLFAMQCPPEDARLIHHGDGFPAFLDHFEHARELPYLGNVARLDRLWTACHTAHDEPGMNLDRLASLSPEQLATLHLSPRAACRWSWFADQPAFSIWRYNREKLDLPDHLTWHGEGALLVRHEGIVVWHPLDAGGCAFMAACAAGQPLAQAAQHACDIQPSLDILELLTRLVSADVFAESAPSLSDGDHHGYATP